MNQLITQEFLLSEKIKVKFSLTENCEPQEVKMIISKKGEKEIIFYEEEIKALKKIFEDTRYIFTNENKSAISKKSLKSKVVLNFNIDNINDVDKFKEAIEKTLKK